MTLMYCNGADAAWTGYADGGQKSKTMDTATDVVAMSPPLIGDRPYDPWPLNHVGRMPHILAKPGVGLDSKFHHPPTESRP